MSKNAKAAKAAAKTTARTPKTVAAKTNKPAAKPNKANGKPAAKASAKPLAKPSAGKAASKPAPPPKVSTKPAPAVVSKAPEAIKKVKSANDISDKLIKMIAEEMAMEEAELTPNASFQDDLNLDEIDVAELLICAEQQFGVKEFSDEEHENCTTVGDLITLVQARVDQKKGAKSAGEKAGKAKK